MCIRDRDTVVKEINNVRSNVHKEKKKHKVSIKSGASADDIYMATLWYYNLFDFLGNQETPTASISNFDDEESDCEVSKTIILLYVFIFFRTYRNSGI